MRNKILVVILVFSSFNIKAQESANNLSCGFLQNLNFQNGVDTIFISAYKTANVRLGPDLNLIKLNKAHKLRLKIFYYAVSFKSLNCTQVYTIACSDTSAYSFNVGDNNYKTVVKMRCIVFEGYAEFSHPYFIIDKITSD